MLGASVVTCEGGVSTELWMTVVGLLMLVVTGVAMITEQREAMDPLFNLVTSVSL